VPDSCRGVAVPRLAAHGEEGHGAAGV